MLADPAEEKGRVKCGPERGCDRRRFWALLELEYVGPTSSAASLMLLFPRRTCCCQKFGSSKVQVTNTFL
jgi:hypothetical protein